MMDYKLSILFWFSISNITSLSYLSFPHEFNINEFISNIIFFLHQIYQDIDYKFVREYCWFHFEYKPLNWLPLFSIHLINFGALIQSVLNDFSLSITPFKAHESYYIILIIHVLIIRSKLNNINYISYMILH